MNARVVMFMIQRMETILRTLLQRLPLRICQIHGFALHARQGRIFSQKQNKKIGKNLIHTVRLGKFENYKAAKKILQDIKPRMPDVIIMKAYLKKERIVRLYGDE